MGYTTEFTGGFNIVPRLAAEHRIYLSAFADVRHIMRDENKLVNSPDDIRKAVGLPVGEEGQYYVADSHDESVIDYNKPPAGCPELYCQWVPNDIGDGLVWDGIEKFYRYVEWLEYLIGHFLRPWNYSVNGVVEWIGEDKTDTGTICVDNNIIVVIPNKKTEEQQ